jgi:flagellin FlaB
MKMRKISKILKTQDVGDMGIGAMIVFIAMVLVAGIAASVLIQTANKLEIQAMTTGQQTTGEVSTGLAVTNIEGKVDTATQRIVDMTITVKARAGSQDIDLAQTVIEITDGTTKVVLSFNKVATWNFNTSVVAHDAQVFHTGAWNETNAEFGVLVLSDPKNTCTSVNSATISTGGVVMLCVNTFNCFGGGLSARTDIRGVVIPEQGAQGIFAFTVPPSLTDPVYDLY